MIRVGLSEFDVVVVVAVETGDCSCCYRRHRWSPEHVCVKRCEGYASVVAKMDFLFEEDCQSHSRRLNSASIDVPFESPQTLVVVEGSYQESSVRVYSSFDPRIHTQIVYAGCMSSVCEVCLCFEARKAENREKKLFSVFETSPDLPKDDVVLR